jgi:hypothetical protein
VQRGRGHKRHRARAAHAAARSGGRARPPPPTRRRSSGRPDSARRRGGWPACPAARATSHAWSARSNSRPARASGRAPGPRQPRARTSVHGRPEEARTGHRRECRSQLLTGGEVGAVLNAQALHPVAVERAPARSRIRGSERSGSPREHPHPRRAACAPARQARQPLPLFDARPAQRTKAIESDAARPYAPAAPEPWPITVSQAPPRGSPLSGRRSSR